MISDPKSLKKALMVAKSITSSISPDFGVEKVVPKGFAEGGAVDDVGKTIPESPMQPERQLTPQGLYSQGAEAARALPQAKGTPDQMLASMKGVKPQEIEHSGFGRWAHGKKHVTRDEMAQRFEHGLPQIEETVREHMPEKWMGTGWLTDARNEQVSRTGGIPPPKFEKYTIPGGENYREVLMHLPQKGLTHDDAAQALFGKPSRYLSEDERQQASDHLRDNPPPVPYKSSHWDTPNVLAHLRMSDRKLPEGGKALHLEELQSDWAQEGRRKGFQTNQDPENPWEVFHTKTGDTHSRHRTREAARAVVDAGDG